VLWVLGSMRSTTARPTMSSGRGRPKRCQQVFESRFGENRFCAGKYAWAREISVMSSPLDSFYKRSAHLKTLLNTNPAEAVVQARNINLDTPDRYNMMVLRAEPSC